MEINEVSIDKLIESLERYVNTNLELYKLKLVRSASLTLGWIVINIFLLFFLCMSFFLVNIAASIWIGQIYGSLIIGFLSVSLVYLFIFLFVFFFFYRRLKSRLIDAVISKLAE